MYVTYMNMYISVSAATHLLCRVDVDALVELVLER